MKKRKEISLSAVAYTIVRRWPIIIGVLIITSAIAFGIMLITGGKKNEPLPTGNTAVKGAESVTIDNKTKADLEGYRSYIENSAYMNLDPNNLHCHLIYYYINFREQGLSPEVLESKYAALYDYIAYYYPSDEFAKEITAVNDDYKNKALYEIVSVGRGGNILVFNIRYTDNYYVKDVCDVIETTLKKKAPEWYSIAGEFDLNHGPETDRIEDGFVSGIKGTQDQKRDTLLNFETTAASKLVNATTTESKGLNKKTMLLLSVVIGFLCSLIAGVILAVSGRKFYSAMDVSDMNRQDVICILKGDKESGVDRSFYKRKERYKDPELYLSILEKNMKDVGIKKVHLYNCWEGDASGLFEKIKSVMSNIEVIPVLEETRKDFYLNAGDDEAAIILVKGGETLKRDYMEILEHLQMTNIKCPGAVFAI